jgi:alpha-galactosidase
MPTGSNTGPMLLRAGGTAVLVDVSGPDLPRVLHWGADPDVPVDDLPALVAALEPGVPASSSDRPWPLTLLPGAADGWPGRPMLRAHPHPPARVVRPDMPSVPIRQAVPDGASGLRGRVAFPVWTATAVETTSTTLSVTATDTALGLEVDVRLALGDAGVLAIDVALRNTGDGPIAVEGITPVLPLPGRACELLDLSGRWGREKSPQRHDLTVGVHARESWRGRPGHSGTPLLVAGTGGFGFGHGEVWGVHVAHGGNAVHLAEKAAEAPAVLGGGELLLPGELALAPGETYTVPTLLAAWSDAGLDGLSARLHGHVRARASHPSSPRPLTLNVWEAVYFDHDLARLTDLADRAAAVGVERYVLDDGWFLGRRDDTTALGDWIVDPQIWPDGLHPLVEHVRGLGMQFGLWFEPEMISLDSEVARAHPDWVLPGRPARHQYVLDVADPAASQYLLERIDALIVEYALDAIKWDHNRDVLQVGAHAQTAAVYALMDELRRRHPQVEIESCAGGGGRTDLGTLARTDRIWTSDCTDPLERQAIQRWTGLLLPPEIMGAHVGAPVSHTTRRTSDLSLRLVTSLFGHAGIEWDITRCSDDELERLQAWSALYKELRGVLHAGRVVRADDAAEGTLLHGVVAPDAAVFAYVRLATGADAQPPRVLLPGLDPARRWRVTRRAEVGDPAWFGPAQPPWLEKGVELPGSVLTTVGLPAPLLHPEQALLLHATAVG